MDGSDDSFDWDSDDEQGAQNSSSSSCPSAKAPAREHVSGSVEAHEVGPSSSKSKLVSHFLGMGFSEKMVNKAIKENGEDNTEAILETLLTYSALEESPPEDERSPTAPHSSESEMDDVDDEFSDADSFLENEEAADTVKLEGKALREGIWLLPDSPGWKPSCRRRVKRLAILLTR